MMLLTNKNVIITGARSGIGKATVELFAKNGANIWACIRVEDLDFKEYANKIANENNVWIKSIILDLQDEENVKNSVKEILLDKQKVDALVNAAGTVGLNRHFHMTNISEMRRIFDINFFNAIYLTQLITRGMAKYKSGVVINVASVAGIDGDPAQLEYSASKAAIINATKKLASEMGMYGIRVNAVAPGLTNTKMLEAMSNDIEERVLERSIMKRRAEPMEIASVIMFLASDLSSFITGQTLRVDGGLQY